MRIPSIVELAWDGLDVVTGGRLSVEDKTWLMTINVIADAAYKDAAEHSAWGVEHGGMEHCELEHRHLIAVIGRFNDIFGSESEE